MSQVDSSKETAELLNIDADLAKTFKNPYIEQTYNSLRENKTLVFLPRLFLLFLCIVTLLRRTEWLIWTVYSEPDKKYFYDEVRCFCISVALIFIEMIFYFSKRFAYLRTIPIVFLCSWLAADGAWIYYKDRINEEPVYTFSSFEMTSVTPFICSLLCHNWISSTIVHTVGQIVLLVFAFIGYSQSLESKLYMIVIIILVSMMFAFLFYSSEWALRCGALQFAQKNLVFFDFG